MMTTSVSETVRKVVAGCIERREWRSSAEQAVKAYAKAGPERKAALAYVKEQYDAAGAGFSGRW